MEAKNYQASISVNADAEHVFNSINEVYGWWTANLEGKTKTLNDEFRVCFGETSINLKLVELIPNKKISWHVADCHKHWLRDPKEWKDTRIDWEIRDHAVGTELLFAHIGLTGELECFGACSNAWGNYLQSLQGLITTGKGKPDAKAKH